MKKHKESKMFFVELVEKKLADIDEVPQGSGQDCPAFTIQKIHNHVKKQLLGGTKIRSMKNLYFLKLY